MVKPVKQSLGFLKTTALGGVIFLLPLIVIGTLLGQVVQVILGVANALSKTLPIDSPRGWTLLVLLAIGVVLAACFVAGFVARWTLGQRLTAWLEKNLTLFFPRYVIVKARMAGSIGGDHAKSELKPVLVRFNEVSRMAFEVERAQAGLVTIYLPGAPDPWAGTVAFVEENRVRALEIDFSEALASFERLGYGSSKAIAPIAISEKSPELPPP
jgi:uncharacterized membrane protein